MWLAQWASRQRRSILFLLLIAAVAGVYAGFNLPVALFPNVEFPRVRVNLEAGDRPVEAMIAQVAEKLGRLDILASNAGIIRSENFLDITPRNLRAIIDVNLNGNVYMCQAAARQMIK